ncbi:unnamed protein product [Schistosoma margrebowiei]|uniref:Uncharacterized protein n=1 Tax=Schistosoma margrebowiei TaxID=48269 RepID=A0A183MDE6_9TREM|nr:unnamed protein product [Schistosoma margrebowiei]
MISLPLLRTNSTSHISSTNGAPSASNHNTNHTNSTTNANKNNNHSRFGASSETILFSSLNPPNESSGSFLGKSTPQLSNNRHLMISSNNSGLLVNENVSRFGTTAEPSLPAITISSSQSSLSNKEVLIHQHPC